MAYFGTLCSPFEMDEWTAATGIVPDFPMIFEHWDQQRPIDRHLAKAKSLGFKRLMLTWEPWTPPATGIGNAAQGAFQPEWSNERIANGDLDAYIKLISKNVRESGLETVYIRWGHEMNGDWHPWRTTPETYIAAWKKIHNIFRGGGTANAKFIWSPNSSLYQGNVSFLLGSLPYWPGPRYVDYVGLTMLNFGGTKSRTVEDFVERFDLCETVYSKPIIATETNTAWSDRRRFFGDLARLVATDNPFSAIILSQPPVSRGQQNLVTDENMQWSIGQDIESALLVKQIQEGLNASPLT